MSWIDDMLAAPVVALDTETYGPTTGWAKKKDQRDFVDGLTAKAACVSLAWGNGSAVIGPSEFVVVRRLFEESKSLVVAHNWLYDLGPVRHILGRFPPVRRLGDSMVLMRLLNEGVPTWEGGRLFYRHGLKPLAEHHYGVKMAEYTDTLPMAVVEGPSNESVDQQIAEYIENAKRKNDGSHYKKTFLEAGKLERSLRKQQVKRRLQSNEVPLKSIEDYAREDAVMTLRLWDDFFPQLGERQWEYFRTVEMPTVRVLREFQENGIKIDEETVADMRSELREELDRLEGEWNELTNGVVITSSKQCSEYLYGGSCPPWDRSKAPRTDTGALSVNKVAVERALESCAEGSLGRELAIIKQRHSKVYKLWNTYTRALVAQLPYRKDGRIRTSFSQVRTDTGRLSASDPNLTAQPRPEEGLPPIKKAFVAEEGNVLCELDFSQLEVVIMAHFSRDPALLDIIRSGKSMHDVTAAALGVERHTAKTINFAKNYQGGPVTIARQLQKPIGSKRIMTPQGPKTIPMAPPEVQEFSRTYDETYAEVTAFHKQCAEFAREHGYVESLMGRRRKIVGINSDDDGERSRAERQASNTRIQASAGDITKLSIIRFWQACHKRRWPIKLLLQIHDAVVYEIPEELAEESITLGKEVMPSVADLIVPLNVEGGYGKTWADCK